MQTACIWMRRTRRLTQIQAVWHSDNIFTEFEWHWRTLKVEADEKFIRRQCIFYVPSVVYKGKQCWTDKYAFRMSLLINLINGFCEDLLASTRSIDSLDDISKCDKNISLGLLILILPRKLSIHIIQSCALLNWKYFRFRCGCTPVMVNLFLSVFHHFLQFLRTLYIVWSLVRRRVTRRLTRLQTMHNVLKYIKTF